MDLDNYGFAFFTAYSLAWGLFGWAILCHRSLVKWRLTVADLLALVLVIGVVLGICSWYEKF